MKKKIVYISGAEVFDVAEVRTAFDEVRKTLNLDKDTILFGVPVDDTEASAGQIEDDQVAVIGKTSIVLEAETSENDGAQAQKDIELLNQTLPEPESIELVDSAESSESVPSDNEGVVPILSVLAANNDQLVVSQEIDAAVQDDIECETEESITDMLNDDVPTDTGEKTLEELLETMAPLREDIRPEPTNNADSESLKPESDEMDMTLESLASEFAETQDKIVAPKKSSERGRIGKLKNILPFKKMKRDDSGLMGDLFGWAGIAANDDDFSMPGFFTGTSPKN